MGYYKAVREASWGLTPGIRLWNNGMPIKADPYRSCSNVCTYCYARALSAGAVQLTGMKYDPRVCRIADLKEMHKLLTPDREGWISWAVRNRYYVEIGCVGEAFQPIDQTLRITWNFINLCRQYKLPLMINTKANLLVSDPSYYELLATYPAPVVVNMTVVTHEDAKGKRLEPNAPLPSERLKLIEKLWADGIPTVIYCGPFIPGVTDSDLEGYVRALIDAKAVGVHVRNFYLLGKLVRMGIWKKYVEEHRDVLKRHGVGYAVDEAVLKGVCIRTQEIAEKIDPRFRVVGMKTEWLDLEPYHGKLPLDWLPQPFKDAIVDFTAIPILRKIRENLDKPQLLLWSKIGYREGKINVPERIHLGGGLEGPYMVSGCKGCAPIGASSPRGRQYMPGYEWVKGGLWNGLTDRPSGFISDVGRIHPVVENGEYARDNGDYVYCYLPKDYRAVSGSVEASEASLFMTPTRAGGVEDKFWEIETYRLPRW